MSKPKPNDGTVAGTFPVGGNPIGVAFDGANIWVANGGGNTVTKLWARDGALLKTLSMCNPYTFAFDGTNIWVTNHSGVTPQAWPMTEPISGSQIHTST